jgi:glycosyltransferase involved in cell wall biosynthesis
MAPSLLKEMCQITFLVVGDGPMREDLEAAVKRGGLRNHFVFTGMMNYEKIPIYINMADLCVLPKRRLKSGYSPLKLYEYMACGKPIIASRVGGLDFIEKEGVGRLVEPEDAKSLKLAILDLLQDPQERVLMGEKGVQMARERFNWEDKVREIDHILDRLA